MCLLLRILHALCLAGIVESSRVIGDVTSQKRVDLSGIESQLDRKQGASVAGAAAIGKALADAATGLVLGGMVDWKDQVPVVEALGREGLRAMLWNEVFMEALVQELQSGNVLKALMTPQALSNAMKCKTKAEDPKGKEGCRKGLIVDTDISLVPGAMTADTRVLLLEFLPVDGAASEPAALVQANDTRDEVVDRLVDGMNVNAFLRNADVKDAMIEFLQESPVLRRALTPEILSSFFAGKMVVRSKLFVAGITKKVRLQLTGIEAPKDGERDTCLAGISRETYNLQADSSGHVAMSVGLIDTLMKRLGVPRVRLLLRRMEQNLIDFLSDGEVIGKVMTASVLQKVLGARVMKGKIQKSGLSMFTSSSDASMHIKCFCDGGVCSWDTHAWKDPSSPYNSKAAAVWGQSDVFGRCLTEGSSCCVFVPSDPPAHDGDERKDVCIVGLGGSPCESLGPGWQKGQRCMPAEPAVAKECAGQIPNSRAGGLSASCTMLNPIGLQYTQAKTLENEEGFNWGMKAAEFTMQLLGERNSPGRDSATSLLGELMGRSGFRHLLKLPQMQAALKAELQHGSVMKETMTAEKLTDAMQGTKMQAMFLGTKLIHIELKEFLPGNSSTQLPTIIQLRGGQDTVQDRFGRAMGGVLDAKAMVKPFGVGDCFAPMSAGEPACAFSIELADELRRGGTLLKAMKADEGKLLDVLMKDKEMRASMDMLLPLGDVDSRVAKVEPSAPNACNFELEGGCPGGRCELFLQVPDPHSDTDFLEGLKVAMVNRIGQWLQQEGFEAMFDSLHVSLVQGLREKGGVVTKIMEEDFVRKLMVGFTMSLSAGLSGFWKLPGQSWVAVCGVEDNLIRF
eukprot:TRINITY_DN26013_c0_g1_i1.p1 TRINITY_DN26013_c0_g1~~TRINITY_DN26013_c0_g1_i1.p1  ORF type:complete len:851 (-),score=213.06 TRINITY_DN26013_c0_g1_i1:211-2763(-)